MLSPLQQAEQALLQCQSECQSATIALAHAQRVSHERQLRLIELAHEVNTLCLNNQLVARYPPNLLEELSLGSASELMPQPQSTDELRELHELRESEAFCRSIIKSSPDCIKVLDLQGNLLSMQSGQALLGIEDIAPFLNKSWLNFWEGDDKLAAQAAVEIAMSGGTAKFIGFFRTLVGDAKWWEVMASPILGVDGRPTRLLVVSRDVTERHKGQEDLRQRTVQFETLLNEAPMGVFMITDDFCISQANPVARKGWPSSPEPIGRNFEELMRSLWPAAMVDEIIQKYCHTLATGESFAATDTVNKRQDHGGQESYDWQIIRIALGDGRYGVVTYFREISERAQAQQAIDESEERYHNLFNTMDQGFCIIDMLFDEHDKAIDYRFMEVNPAFEPLTGLHEATGKRMREIVPNHDQEWFEIYGEVALTGNAKRFMNQAHALGERWFDVYASRLGGPKSRKVALLFSDITDRMSTDKALRHSEERFRAFVTASADVMYRMSPDWHEMQQLQGQNFIVDTTAPDADWLTQYIDAQDQPHVMAVVQEAIKTKSLYDLVHRVRRADGTLGWTHSRAVPLLDQAGEITEWFGTASDVTDHKRAEQALRESDEHYRNLFNAIDEGFCIIEMIFDANDKAIDYYFVEVNPSFERHSGLHNVTGKRVRELLPDLEENWFEIYGRVAQTGEPIRFVNELKTQNRWLDVYAARLGQPGSGQVAVVFSNITERTHAEQALRQSEARFRALFDWGPLAMYTVDAAGVIQEFNRNAELLWGRKPKPYDASEFYCGSYKMHHPDGRALEHAQTPVAAVLSGEIPAAHDVEVVMERPDGSKITVIANVVPLKNSEGEITGALNCLYDITERSRLERETLEQAQTMITLDRRKDEFLAMLNHELRNPIAAIFNAVDLLKTQKNETLVQQQGRSIIARQVGQLKHLVDDLLEVSRITTGTIRIRKEQISVSTIVQNALETTASFVKQRNQELIVSVPPEPIFLYADAARIEQVIVNLLTNAAKYTNEGGRIWLHVETQDADEAFTGPMAVLTVRDNGIGIAPELLPRIFDLFTQAERSLDRSQGGLGIGLSLVQRLVELHDGTIQAASILGQGSEFIVRLPVMHDVLPADAPPPLEKPQTLVRSCRVLVVDDNVDAAQSLALLLEMTTHEVRLVYDGPSAVQAAIDFLPDVVLLDIGLPGLNGYEVAQQLRQHVAFKSTVLVALTGYGLESDRKRSQAAGFDHHLVKPADFDEIETILAAI